MRDRNFFLLWRQKSITSCKKIIIYLSHNTLLLQARSFFRERKFGQNINRRREILTHFFITKGNCLLPPVYNGWSMIIMYYSSATSRSWRAAFHIGLRPGRPLIFIACKRGKGFRATRGESSLASGHPVISWEARWWESPGFLYGNYYAT